MNLFNKLTAGFMAAALIVTSLPLTNVAAANLAWEEATLWAIDNGLTSHSTYEAAAPLANITREAFAAISVRGFDAIAQELTADDTLNCDYADLDSAQAGLQDYVVEACEKGLFQDADDATSGKFNPKTTVSEAVVSVIFCKALFTEEECTAEAGEAFYTAANRVNIEEGVMVAEKSNSKMASRGMVFQMFMNVAELVDDTEEEEEEVLPEEEDEDTTEEEGTVVNPSSKGNLDIAVATSSPSNKQIPSKGSNIKVLTLDVTAGSDDVVIKSIVVSKFGFTNANSVKELYLRNKDDVIVTNLRTFNNDGTASLTVKGGLTVKEGSTEKLSLFMNVDGAGSEQYQFSIDSVSAISTNAKEVSGTFPIVSSKFDSVAYASQTLKYSPLTGSIAEVTVGDTNTEVGKFQLEVIVTGSNRNDVIIRTITLKNTRTIADNLDDLVLKTSSEVVSDSVVVTDKFVTFTLKPGYSIEDGQSKTFYIYADVVGGDINDKINFTLDNTSDIYAYEKEGNQASAFVSAPSGLNMREYNVKEGDNLITKASNSPSVGYVDQDSSKTLLMVANVNFKSAVNVEKMNVNVTDASGAVDTLAVYANAPMGESNSVKLDEVSVTTTTGAEKLSIYRDLQGLTKLYFYVETKVGAVDGAKFKVAIDNNSFPSAEYVSSNNTVLNTDINGSATSSEFTVKKSALNSLSRTDGFSSSSETIVAGDNVYLGEFAVSHNNVRDIEVNGITISLVSGSGQYVNTLKLVGEGLDVVKSVTSQFSQSVVFNSLDFLVPKGVTKKFKLYGNLNTSYVGGLQLKVKLSDVESIKADGSTTQFADTSLTDKDTAVFAVANGATFEIAKISDSTPAVAVIVPDVANTIARYDFKVTKDSATIQELAFTGTEGAYNAGVEFAVFAQGATDPSTTRQSLVKDGTNYYISFNGLNLPLAKAGEPSYYVKARTSSTIDTLDKTNVPVAVTLVKDIAGTTAKTKIISNANSAEITSGAFAL